MALEVEKGIVAYLLWRPTPGSFESELDGCTGAVGCEEKTGWARVPEGKPNCGSGNHGRLESRQGCK